MNIIEFRNVWEKYRIKFIKGGQVSWDEIWALSDISFLVPKGEILGVIGRNGAGKTTLLKLIAGMLLPDKGDVQATGRVATLMELGAGFNPEFTGRENINLNAKMYGFDQETLDARMDGILAFAGLDKFIDAPIKYYSQGMYMRLVFALAIFVEPDILLVDDILSVGDHEAQEKCFKKMLELKDSGKTIVLVSHDMDMVRRLCHRVILLQQGKIAKQGTPGEVISYYLETAGNQDGAAVLSCDPIRVVFNNGRVFIYHCGWAVTKGNGGYASLMPEDPGHRFFSYDLDWKVSDRSQSQVTARGSDRSGVVVLTWSLAVDNNGLRCCLEINKDRVKDIHMDLLIDPVYAQWAGLIKEGDFGPFAHKFNWQEVAFLNAEIEEAAVKPGIGEPLRPALFFASQNEDSRIRLFNTGYDIEARAAQFLKGKGAEILFSVNFIKSQRAAAPAIKVIQAINDGLVFLGSEDLQLCIDPAGKVIRLYHKGAELTRGVGLHSAFYTPKGEKWYVSSDAAWSVQKFSDTKITLTLDYEPLSLGQAWTFSFPKDGHLKIDVTLNAGTAIFLTNQRAGIEIDPDFSSWATPNEEGDLVKARYVSGIAPMRLKDSKASEVLMLAHKDSPMPSFVFSSVSKPGRQILSLYKRRHQKEECLCINFSKIIPHKEGLLEPGTHSYFQGDILLESTLSSKGPSSLFLSPEAKKSGSRVVFDEGRLRFFYRDKELTKGLCGYTSLRAGGIWYDSYQAAWEELDSKDGQIVRCGHWPYLPVSQVWRVTQKDENTFVWSVEMEVYEDVALELEQTNLMLIKEYGSWSSFNGCHGDFRDGFTQDYDILPFRFWSGETEQLCAVDKIFPKVIFLNSHAAAPVNGIIENSDDLHQARLLQYQAAPVASLNAGKYPYFSGVIRIEPV